MTIVEFLEARLNEAAARASDPIKGEIHHVDCESIREHIPYPCECGIPERILADVEAKRAVIALHQGAAGWCGWSQDSNETHGDEPCGTLIALASAYVDHPDHQGWKI